MIDEVIKAYWKDYEQNKNSYMPGFLANDILRMWRTFCVNYEARTYSESVEEMAERRLKNYKLKHSRLLTCYSAILSLLAIYRQKQTLTPVDTLAIIHRSPTERLEWLLEQSELSDAYSNLKKLLEQYERFLCTTNRDED